jgi:proteasome assembly chaperone (PAC2) family protein
METIQVTDVPSLKDPVLIMGFAGWPNAGEVSSGALNHLITVLKAKKFAQIQPGPFYDFTTHRPIAVIDKGMVKGFQFTPNEFYYRRQKDLPHDLILFQGQEPNLRWELYVESILEVAAILNVQRIFTIGGTYDNVPHSVEPKVSASVTDERLKERLIPHGIAFSQYNGPMSIHTLLLSKAKEKKLQCISLWGHAPYYIQAHNTKVSYSVLFKIEKILGSDLRLETLKKSSEYLEKQIDRAIEKKPELRDYLRNLEREFGKEEKAAKQGPMEEEGQGEKVVQIEAFLKKYPFTEEERED